MIEILSFHISCIISLRFSNEGKQYMINLKSNVNRGMKLKKFYAEKSSEADGMDIKRQHWGGNRQLSTEVVSLEFILDKKIKNGVYKVDFHSYNSNDKKGEYRE